MTVVLSKNRAGKTVENVNSEKYRAGLRLPVVKRERARAKGPDFNDPAYLICLVRGSLRFADSRSK